MHILLFGAGKSATVLINYLKKQVAVRQWKLTVADGDLPTVLSKLGNQEGTVAVQLDILDAATRKSLVQQADVVISLLPPSLHYHIAVDCLHFGKHLLTASYVDEKITALKDQIEAKGLLFLCEMGLDPGIDHMSAMQLIHRIQAQGGRIHSFRSHCGGLVAPESDDNPWHYKISWNPRNVVLAGKAGAWFREQGRDTQLPYELLFAKAGTVHVPSLGQLACYANRDSLGYIDLYQLYHTSTFIRTTLRHPDFCKGWAWVVDHQLTDEEFQYDTDGMSMPQFLHAHAANHGWLWEPGMLTNDPVIQHQLDFLGITGNLPINKGLCTAADILQWRMECSWVLQPDDKDMIVMLHEIEYELHGKKTTCTSSLIVKGEDHIQTAMAKTVGLPLGIAAVLIAEGRLVEKGLHIPIIPSIYEPVLPLLEKEGIIFHEH